MASFGGTGLSKKKEIELKLTNSGIEHTFGICSQSKVVLQLFVFGICSDVNKISIPASYRLTTSDARVHKYCAFASLFFKLFEVKQWRE